MRSGLLIVLAACGPAPEPDPPPACDERAIDIPIADISELGFAPKDLMLSVDGTHIGVEDATVTVEAAYGGGRVRLVKATSVDEVDPETPFGCQNRVEMDMSWQLTRDDGVLDESFVTPVVANRGEVGWFLTTLDRPDLLPVDFGPHATEEVSASGWVGSGDTAGSVDAVGRDEAGEVVETVTLASW